MTPARAPCTDLRCLRGVDCFDGSVSKAEFDAGVPLPTAAPVDAAPVLAKFDANKDGSITAAEFRAPTIASFNALDANNDGVLSSAERQKEARPGR